ncbi:MAG: DNA polymerase III subunit delta [Pseudomonadota bacterium]|nr:DNA polymerase III subunit delta [Pseudomonadota bacterium]
MAASSTNDFYQRLEKEARGGTFWLFGAELYLIQDGIERICQKLFGTPHPTLSENLNYEIYYGSECDSDHVREAITSLPFFSDFKLVVVKECERFRDKDFEILSEAIAHKDPSVTLVLISDQVDKRTKSYKKIEKLCQAVEFRPPYERDLPQWVQYLAQQQKLQIGSREALLLLSTVGSDLMMINNEVKKISLGLGGRTQLEEADILKFSFRGKDENVFALSDHLATRSTTQALALLKKLLEQGLNSVAIISLIARHFRILLTITEGKRLGLEHKALMERLALPPFFFKKYWEQSQKWDQSSLAGILLQLANTDKSLKSSPLSPSLVLEHFILSLSHVKS